MNLDAGMLLSAIPPAYTQFPPRSLYLHIPFCAGRCSYCDFFSVRSTAYPQAPYIDALLEQLRVWSSSCGTNSFDTIYIGGGTPSVLDKRSLEKLLTALSTYAAHGCEWTIEANPESLSEQFLEILAESGVTRLSLGIQTLSVEEWDLLGRIGSIAESRAALERARTYPFDLSLDLLVGIPHRSGMANFMTMAKTQLLTTLSELAPQVAHLSLYDLTLEYGTALEHRVKAGELSMPDADDLAELRLIADEFLESVGFYRYEVSNYARKGHECRHNAAYWNMEPYLGVGSGAVSTLHLRDPDNPSMLGSLLRMTGNIDLARYTDNPSTIPPNIERIDRNTALFEFLMMGFRTARGVDTKKIEALFGIRLFSILPRTLARWKSELVWRGDEVSLYPRNFDILNRFLVECMEELS